MAGDFFDFLIFVGNLCVVILNRGGHVAGQHFAGIMVHGQQGNTANIDITVEFTVFDHGKRVRDKGDLQTVFGDIFCPDIAHQRPAANEFQAG
ncbi:hypothetical protein DZS_16290 [Dickeya ananatis]